MTVSIQLICTTPSPGYYAPLSGERRNSVLRRCRRKHYFGASSMTINSLCLPMSGFSCTRQTGPERKHCLPRRCDMSTLKEMAFEYKQAAAKLAMAIERHKTAGDLTEAELQSLRRALRETREAAHLLSGYYDAPRPECSFTLQGLKPRRTRDDH